MRDGIHINCNVLVRTFDKVTGEELERREGHNVFTNTGRTWMSQLVGASSYASEDPEPHVTTKIGYIGFGCGGAGQTDPNHLSSRREQVNVVALEDAVPLSVVLGASQFLKQVYPQSNTSLFFPADYTTRFIVDLLESEISFTGNQTINGVLVNTDAPVSEMGLYLSDAKNEYTPGDPQAGEADPRLPNRLVAYHTFSPLHKTSGVTLRVEWELYFS